MKINFRVLILGFVGIFTFSSPLLAKKVLPTPEECQTYYTDSGSLNALVSFTLQDMMGPWLSRALKCKDGYQHVTTSCMGDLTYTMLNFGYRVTMRNGVADQEKYFRPWLNEIFYTSRLVSEAFALSNNPAVQTPSLDQFLTFFGKSIPGFPGVTDKAKVAALIREGITTTRACREQFWSSGRFAEYVKQSIN